MLAQLLLKGFLPRHETEPQAVIDHSELTAGKLGCAHKMPHDIIAGDCWLPRPPAFGQILGDLPMILVDPLDMARTAQGFKPADVGFDEGLGITPKAINP